jgi:hypothetical protein
MPHAAPFSVADHGPGMDTLHPGPIATKPQSRHRISPVKGKHIPAGSEFLPFQTICQGGHDLSRADHVQMESSERVKMLEKQQCRVGCVNPCERNTL